jgi:hypothetical protein
VRPIRRERAASTPLAILGMSLALIIGLVWYYSNGFSFNSIAGKLTIKVESYTLFAGSLPVTPSCSSGSAQLVVSLYNPTATTAITSVTLSGQNVYVVVNSYFLDSNHVCSKIAGGSSPVVTGGQTNLYTIYFASGNSSPSQLSYGLTYNFVITYADGETNSGSAIAQQGS